MTASRADTPLATRALGVVGIVGGLVLLAAFVVDIPSGLEHRPHPHVFPLAPLR